MGRITKAKIKKGKFGTALKKLIVENNSRVHRESNKRKYTKAFYEMIKNKDKEE